MSIQLIATQNNTGLSAFKAAVWNPLDFLQPKVEESSDEIDEQWLADLEAEIVPVLGRLNAPVTNVRAEMPTVGYEVGDDKADLSFSTINLGRSLVYQEKIFKMKTSWKDTFISYRVFNFCEVTSPLPSSLYESMDYARKSDSLKHLGFCDTPVLRLIGNVQKGDRSHSSSATGKASMVARRLMTPRTSNRPVLMLASFLQDGCLNTSKSDEPKYLPGIMGGAGCPPLWDNPANVYLYAKAYKNGTYSRVYGTAANECRYAVDCLDGGRPASALLCERLREKQEYLHITYAQNVLIHPRTMQKDYTSARYGNPQPLYTAAGGQAFVQAAERRLVAAKRLLTRTQAEVEMMRTERIIDTVLGLLTVREQKRLSNLQRREKSKQFESALRANSAVQKLLERSADGSEVKTLIREGFLNVGVGVKDITLEDAYWLARGGIGDVYTIHDLTRSEDMFIRTEVSLEESMKVPGIFLQTRLSGGKTLARDTKAKVGLWEVSVAVEEWADNVVSKLQFMRDYGYTPGPREVLHVLSENREWVSDDSILIELAREYTQGKPVGTLVLVSADVKLARHMAKATGFHVVSVHPESVIKNVSRESWSSLTEFGQEELNELLKDAFLEGRIPAAQKVFVDTGSFSSFAMKMEDVINAHGQKTGALQKTSLIYSDQTVEGRISRHQVVLVNRNSAFRAKIIAANGTERNVTIGRVEPEIQKPGPIRSRVGKLTHLFKRR